MGMLWKIQKICSTMGTKIFEIDEKMSEIIDAKVGNPQNSTSKKWANFSQPWNLAFFQDYIFKKYVHFQSQRVPKWKIAHIWQSKEHKNNKITPKNVSQKGLQSLPDVLQHPVEWKGGKIYDFQKVTFSTLFKLYIAGLGVLIPKRYHMLG